MMMTNANELVESRDVRLRRKIDRWRVTIERAHEADDDLIEATLDLALELKEIRDECGGNDRRFGEYLAENGLHLSADDRAALIHMAEHPELSRQVLMRTSRQSLRRIWEEEIRPQVEQRSDLSSPTIDADQTLLPAQQTGPQEETPAAAGPPSSVAEPAAEPAVLPPYPPPPRQSPFFGRERAAEVYNIYRDPYTRRTIGSALKGETGEDIWDLFLFALDLDFLTPTDQRFRKASARLLFPGGGDITFDDLNLTDQSDLEFVRDDLMEAAFECRDEILAEPHRVKAIIDEYFEAAEAKAEAKAEAEADDEADEAEDADADEGPRRTTANDIKEARIEELEADNNRLRRLNEALFSEKEELKAENERLRPLKAENGRLRDQLAAALHGLHTAVRQ